MTNKFTIIIKNKQGAKIEALIREDVFHLLDLDI